MMATTKWPTGEMVVLVVVLAVALVSAANAYSNMAVYLVADREALYVLLFGAPIGVLALVDLVRPDREGGTMYRAGLGAAGGISALVWREHLHLGVAFVTAYLLYGVVCALGLLAWRRRSTPPSL